MGSLAGCLRLHNMTGAEAAYIRKLSGEYKAEGFTPQERNERAAQDVLKLQLDSHADIVKQIRRSNQLTPNVTETPQSNIQEPISKEPTRTAQPESIPERLAKAVGTPNQIDVLNRLGVTDENKQIHDIVQDAVAQKLQTATALANKGDIDTAFGLVSDAEDNARKLKLADGPITEAEVNKAMAKRPNVLEEKVTPTPERLAFVRDMMTETAGPTKIYGAEGEVTGKTKSQRPKWLQDTVSEYMLKYPKARAIIDKFLSGGDLTPNQQKFINDVVNRSADDYEKIKGTYETKAPSEVMRLPIKRNNILTQLAEHKQPLHNSYDPTKKTIADIRKEKFLEGKMPLEDRAALLERSGQKEAADKLRASESFALTSEAPTEANRKPTQQGLPMDTTSGALEGKLPEGKAYEPTELERAQQEAAGRATQAEEARRQEELPQGKTINWDAIPEGHKVEVTGIKDGKEIKYKEDARQAAKDAEADVSMWKSLLECMKA